MRYIYITLLSILSSGAFGYDSLFNFKLGEIIDEEQSIKLTSKSKTIKMYNQEKEITVYESKNYKSQEDLIFNYKLRTNSQNNRLYSINYNLFFPKNYNVITVLSWLEEKFGNPTSGPMQTFIIDGPIHESRDITSKLRYSLTWGCSLKSKYSKPFETLLFFQDQNNSCIKAVVNEQKSETYSYKVMITISDNENLK